MRRYYILFVIISFGFTFANVSCNSKKENSSEVVAEEQLENVVHYSNIPIDSSAISSFTKF